MTVRMQRPLAIVVLLIALGFCRVPFVNGTTLTGTFTPVPRYTNVDLTAEGRLDWVHWGLITDSSLDRKAGVTPQIPDFIPIRLTAPTNTATILTVTVGPMARPRGASPTPPLASGCLEMATGLSWTSPSAPRQTF